MKWPKLYVDHLGGLAKFTCYRYETLKNNRLIRKQEQKHWKQSQGLEKLREDAEGKASGVLLHRRELWAVAPADSSRFSEVNTEYK